LIVGDGKKKKKPKPNCIMKLTSAHVKTEVEKEILQMAEKIDLNLTDTVNSSIQHVSMKI